MYGTVRMVSHCMWVANPHAVWYHVHGAGCQAGLL